MMNCRLCSFIIFLSDSWKTFIVTISNFAPNGVISFYVIKESISNEELRIKEMRVDNSQILVVENGKEERIKVPRGMVNRIICNTSAPSHRR